MNPTGKAIEALRRGDGREAIVDQNLRVHFDVHGEDLARDLDEFVHLLRQHGLVGEGGDR